MRNPRHRNGTSAGDHASEPANYGFTPQMLIWAALWADRLKSHSDRYIADFVCDAAGLIVEPDGGHHFEEDHVRRDRRRDAFPASQAFTVLSLQPS
jgi:very-short-patch-repair endonuclease